MQLFFYRLKEFTANTCGMDYKKYYTTNDTNKAVLTAFAALVIMEYGFEPTDP